MLPLLALLLQVYNHGEPRVTPVAQHGPFLVEREDIVKTGLAVLHEMPQFPKARLIWSSADGLVQGLYEDDGVWLRFGFRMNRKTRTGPGFDCSLLMTSTVYAERPAGAAGWRESVPALRKALSECGGFEQAAAGYEREWQAAAPEAAAAGTSLRSLARTMFHDLKRCTRERTHDVGGFPEIRCVHKAGPA